MSYITLDYKCDDCDSVTESFVRKSERDNQLCQRCGRVMRELPSGPITTFKFGDRAAIKSKKVVSFRD